MSQPQRPATFLEELEARQDEVLLQLDDLNQRVEQLLRQWTGKRDRDVDGLESRAAPV